MYFDFMKNDILFHLESLNKAMAESFIHFTY